MFLEVISKEAYLCCTYLWSTPLISSKLYAKYSQAAETLLTIFVGQIYGLS